MIHVVVPAKPPAKIYAALYKPGFSLIFLSNPIKFRFNNSYAMKYHANPGASLSIIP